VWRPPGYRRLRRVKLNRHWRAFLIALSVCAALGLAVVSFAPQLAGLFLLCIYNIPANSILPVPHEPAILYFAKFYHPALVALAATAGSVAVSFADYGIVEAAMNHPRIAGAREARLFRWAVKWMMRFPFWTLVLFSFIPVLPIYVVRVLAPASGYPSRRYVLALIVGRYPRFLALAWLGRTIDLPTWVIVAMLVLLISFTVIASRKTSAAGLDDDEEDEKLGQPLEIPDLSDPENPGASARIPRSEPAP
jgi:membrane protein YqaA with SNARE-associated domain